MNLFKKCTAKLYNFLVKYNTFFLANPFCFRYNLLEKILELFTKIGDMIRY